MLFKVPIEILILIWTNAELRWHRTIIYLCNVRFFSTDSTIYVAASVRSWSPCLHHTIHWTQKFLVWDFMDRTRYRSERQSSLHEGLVFLDWNSCRSSVVKIQFSTFSRSYSRQRLSHFILGDEHQKKITALYGPVRHIQYGDVLFH